MTEWRIASATVIGTSHIKTGTECQDSHSAVALSTPSAGECLLVAVSDGAGTAKRSKIGSEMVCSSVIKAIASHLESGSAPSSIGVIEVQSWLKGAQDLLQGQAEKDGAPLREYSCTCLGALISEDTGIFFQIGDGAIVVNGDDSEEFDYVTWPQKGEFANTTQFLTDSAALENAEIQIVPRRIKQIAVFSDGLESLALDFRANAPFSPFFRAMFRPFGTTETDLSGKLKDFLTSEEINKRTDDDKTLVLACR